MMADQVGKDFGPPTRWQPGAACWTRSDDPFITRELHTRKALDRLAIAASTNTTQMSQLDQIEVMYAQNTPTPEAVSLSQMRPFSERLRPFRHPGDEHITVDRRWL